MGIFDTVLTEGQEIASLFDADGELKVPRLLLVDSGAFIHTCPRAEFPGSVLRPLGKAPRAVVADGRQLKMYGTKTVDFSI
eukprot:826844-Heterocapsa_arctica.AAC.1